MIFKKKKVRTIRTFNVCRAVRVVVDNCSGDARTESLLTDYDSSVPYILAGVCGMQVTLACINVMTDACMHGEFLPFLSSLNHILDVLSLLSFTFMFFSLE